MNRRAHIAIGAASTTIAVLAIRTRFPNARLPHPVLAGIVGAAAACLPDLLEPALTPHHRQFCHSVAFAAAMAVGLKSIYDWNPPIDGQRFLRDVLLAIGLGYLSHLGADATTAAGLPWVGSTNPYGSN